jgi:3-deoxy-D-manno-octulosonic-acid transferase
VGEVQALGPVIQETMQRVPSASCLVSTGTETGQATAKSILPQASGIFFLPLDFPWTVNRVVDRIRPDLFILMETELWPNLINTLKRHETHIILANGRISDRSFPRYKFMRSLFSKTLEQIDLFLMASELDAMRIIKMGASQDRVHITGNTKFDAVCSGIDESAPERISQILHLDPESRVLVAGSTHPGEEEALLDAYSALRRQFPDLVLIIVPRHVERAPEIVSLVSSKSLPEPFLRSSLGNGSSREGRPIVIWDKTGELRDVYSVASVVFVGGSLVKKGGQNIIEPAVWEKIVVFGPSMEDFRDARDILIRCRSGIEVRNGKELVSAFQRVLADPDTYQTLAGKGRETLMSHRGSAARNAQFISRYLMARERE